MKTLSKKIMMLARYFEKFGFQGIMFYLKMLFKRHQIISFPYAHFPHPIFLRSNTSDFLTFNQVFLYEEYLMEYDSEPKVIVDCGANIGLATLYFKHKFPNAKIISIEPEQSNFELLTKNTKAYSNVFCLQGGIWNKPTNLVIKDVGLGNWGFMIEESETSTQESIKAYTLDQIMNQFALSHIDILKIDIEGSERELFESNYAAWLPKTKVLIIELHDKMRPGCSKSVFNALYDFNFSTAQRGENIFVFLN